MRVFQIMEIKMKDLQRRIAMVLKKEFQDSLRPPPRAQMVRIGFDAGQPQPTLFARPRISAASWWSLWPAPRDFAASESSVELAELRR